MEVFLKHSLTYVSIGPFRVIEPSRSVVIEMREKAEAHLRSKYHPGTYSDGNKCNEIFQFMFSFYESELNTVLPKIATSRWVGEIIYQFERVSEISTAYKKEELSKEEATYWRSNGALLRQALDYLCEKLCIHGKLADNWGIWQAQIPDFEKALICAKKCVEFSSVSNYTHMIVPDATVVSIYAPGEKQYLEHTINEAAHRIIAANRTQNDKEVMLRDKYMDPSFDPFDFKYHVLVLDKPFQSTFGISYAEYQALVSSLVVYSKKIEKPENAPMSWKEDYIFNLAEGLGLPLDVVSIVLSQLILDRNIPRKVWDSRQFNRINKRPILEFVYRGRPVLMWAHKKIEEYFTLLDNDLTFNKCPRAWDSKALTSAVTEISNQAGKWFERSSIKQLNLMGFQGRRIKEKTFKKVPGVRFDCGEIDYLAYHPATRCLAIFEFKMFETGFDAKGIRQTKDQFMNEKDGYIYVFQKKIDWIKSNIDLVRKFFHEECGILIPEDTKEARSTFITYYPCLIGLFTTQIRSISLVQFVEDFSATGTWPYDN
jgi:hypothetical protein